MPFVSGETVPFVLAPSAKSLGHAQHANKSNVHRGHLVPIASFPYFVYLDQAETDENDSLRGFWGVELDTNTLARIAYNGIVPAIPQYCPGSSENS